jgi:hypothetical protein
VSLGAETRDVHRQQTPALRLKSSSVFNSATKQNHLILVRSFSKFSTDSNEVVVQEPDPPPPSKGASKTATTPALTKEAAVDIVQSNGNGIECNNSKVNNAPSSNNRNGINSINKLREARVILHKTCTDAQALLPINNSATSDERVAMADYFLILVNSLALEQSVETIQQLYNEESANNNVQKSVEDGGEDDALEEVKSHAIKSMHSLHRVFISMVESCVPPVATTPNEDSKSTNFPLIHEDNKYTAKTVGRALQISRRAEELGMPLHRPLYRRLALGIVSTSHLPEEFRQVGEDWPWQQDELELSRSSFTESDDTSGFVTNASPTTEQATSKAESTPKLVLSGQFQQIKERLHMPPLAMELLDLCQRAQVALNCSFSSSMTLKEQIQQFSQQQIFALEILTEPCLQLLKRKQFEEALGLIRGWEAKLGRNNDSIDLMLLMGEEQTLEALDIAKGWLVGTSFGDDILSNPHANELINLLQLSLAKILKDRKEQADSFARVLTTVVALQGIPQQHENDYDEDDSDFEDDDEYDSYDSDSEDEGGEKWTPTLKSAPVTELNAENFPLVLGKHPLNFQDSVEQSAQDITEIKEAKDDVETLIVDGVSNDVVRDSIYLRNGKDWLLPDIVTQLEEWNKGQTLTFTPEFEKHLGWQMTKEDEEDDDDDWR